MKGSAQFLLNPFDHPATQPCSNPRCHRGLVLLVTTVMSRHWTPIYCGDCLDAGRVTRDQPNFFFGAHEYRAGDRLPPDFLDGVLSIFEQGPRMKAW